MCLKCLGYGFIIYFSLMSLPVNAEVVASSEPATESTLTLNREWIEDRQKTIAKVQVALKKARTDLESEEQALQKKIAGLAQIEQVSQKMLDHATEEQHKANQSLEKQRLERQNVQVELDKFSEHLAKLQSTLEELTQYQEEKQTVAQNKRISKVKKEIALQQKAVNLQQQYLDILKTQTELAIKRTLLTFDWEAQLQMAHKKELIQKRKQAIADVQTTLKRHQDSLKAEQDDLPNKITLLETTEAAVEQLKEQFEKATLEKQAVEVELKNLEVEHQNAETTLEKQSKSIAEQAEKLETLRKTPPVESEQIPLHKKRIAVLKKTLEQQKQILALEQQQLDILKLRIEQANKRSALSTEWYNALQAKYRLSQKQALENQIQQEQQRHIARATELHQQLALIPALMENTAQRYLLEVQIQRANELAQQATRQLKIQYTQEQFQQWRDMAETQKNITNVTQSELDDEKVLINEINELLLYFQTTQTSLQDKIAQIKQQQDIVKDRNEILTSEALKQNQQAGTLLKTLKHSLQQELDAMPLLLKKGQFLLTTFKNLYKENVRRALLRQRQLPASGAEWWSLFKEMTVIPSFLVQQLQLTWRGFIQAVQQISMQRGFIIAIVMFIWLSIVIMIGALAKKRIQQVTDMMMAKNLAIGLRLWHKNTYKIAIAGVLLLFLWLIQPNQLTLLVILILLLTWLGSKLLIDLSTILILASDTAKTNIKLHRQIRRTIIILSVLTVITALVHLEHDGQVTFSLTARDLMDSIFLILLSLAVPPLMRVRQHLLTAMRSHIQGYWILVTNLVSLLLPGAMVAVSILGIIGYISLSWKIAEYLSVFLLVLIGLLIVYGLLNNLVNLWKGQVLKKSPYGSLLAEDIIPLVHKLLQLSLLGAAIIAFFWLTGWYSDVAMKESIGKMLHFPLVTFQNGNNITVLDVLLSVFIIWIVFWLGGWSRRVSYRWVLFNISDSGVRHSLSVFIQYSVILIGLFVALKTIGIDPTALTVFAGAVGVGLGFGLQNVANNFISGILLLIERPLRVGDFIEIESPTGTEVRYNGTVTHIGIRSLTLNSQNNKKIIVPNSSVISSPFKNAVSSSHSDESQMAYTKLNIGISYDSDPHVVESLIKELLNNTMEILKEPAPKVYLSEFSDFKIDFRINYAVDTKKTDALAVKSKVLFQIWDRFKVSGIKIPYLQQDVHIKPMTKLEDQ